MQICDAGRISSLTEEAGGETVEHESLKSFFFFSSSVSSIAAGM